MPAPVVGRDAELASLHDFVERVAAGAAALVLEGEAGMGKTTLWRAALAHAEGMGVTVLQAQPVESETTLSYAGIADLLDPVLEDALEPLPAVQQRALTRALVLSDDEGPPLDPRALSVAVMNALRILAEHRPVLIAIDDSQWLDFASSAGLAYGVRRFRTERIGLLLSRRSGLESALLNELLRSPAGERFTRVHVGALDVQELGRVVHEHLGLLLPRPLLAEVHTAAGGNPFYALEFVRMLQRTGASIEAGQPVPLPESLHDLVHGRVLALPVESRDFLLAVAAHAHPTIAITEAATGLERAVGLAPALDARVVELDGERIRFTHPLLAAGVYDAASPLRRIEIHRRLAELLEDPEARAWQLAASVTESDESVALVLEDAAHHARARGALRPAALLLDRAQELTPAEQDAASRSRAVDAAFLHFEAGDSRRAAVQLRTVISELPAGRARAKALSVLGRIRTYEEPHDALRLFRQAIDEAEGDRATLAMAHEGVASSLLWLLEGLVDAAQHAEAAAELALACDDKALAAHALVPQLLAQALLGGPDAARTASEAVSAQSLAAEDRLLDQPMLALVQYWLWIDEPERARVSLLEMLRNSNELGDESSRPYLLSLLAQVDCTLGNLDDALARAREGADVAEQSAQPLFAALSHAVESLAEAMRGRAEEAREAARRSSTSGHGGEVMLIHASAVGHLELASANIERVVACLEPAVDLVRREAMAEPGAARFVIDQVEALTELGRRDEAGELLDWYEGNARRLARASALANCARCRGMLAAQVGDLEAALAAHAQALAWHDKVELPLDRGRTMLALGAAQRRMKRRREARETLEEALAAFERIGAVLWAERARGELSRISGRAATPGALTPAEERVAALVAEGKTNREVAAALFLSDRTVEGHLAHIFGKFGIRHRTEIAAALVARQTQGIDAPNTGDAPVSAEPSAP